MPRRLKITGMILLLAVLIGAIYLPRLRQRVRSLKEAGTTEEQARREVAQLSIATPSDVKTNARVFWASTVSSSTLEPVDVQLPLSADPAQRAKQLLSALISSAPSSAQRTLPADAALIEFYLLPDGTGIADFSDALATATPSGILSEQIAVDSIVKTLAANVDKIQRLKILIHGQEAETLAGHVDLTVMFPVRSEAAATPAGVPAPDATGKPSGGGLTRPNAPGKLAR